MPEDESFFSQLVSTADSTTKTWQGEEKINEKNLGRALDVSVSKASSSQYDQVKSIYGWLTTADMLLSGNHESTAVEGEEQLKNLKYDIKNFKSTVSIAGKDLLGRLTHKGHKCPVCGGYVGGSEKLLTAFKKDKLAALNSFGGGLMPSGYCSIKCAAIGLEQKLISSAKPDKTFWTDLKEKVNETITLVNMVSNMLTMIPSYLIDLENFPDPLAPVQEYLMREIDIKFFQLRIEMNKLSIKINDWIINLLKRMQSSKTGNLLTKEFKGVFSAFNTAIDLVSAVQSTFNQIYAVAYADLGGEVAAGSKVIKSKTGNVPSNFSISAQASGFANVTPKGRQKYPNKMFVEIKKSSQQQDTILDWIDNDLFNRTIDKVSFPPIKEVEYFLDPEVFEQRLIFSDHNAKGRIKLSNFLLPFINKGSEAYPKYEKILPYNIWWLLYLLNSLGPMVSSLYGLPGYP